MDAKVELDKKLTLSVEEASELSGIGIHTIYRMMKNPKYDFVLWIGKKRRIKRVEFEKTIRNPEQILNKLFCDYGLSLWSMVE